MADRVDRTERLLNLVIALMGTSRALPRQSIREHVPGYSEATSDAAFERMFERDKDELRSMGIPIDTVMDDAGDVLGYRIVTSVYAMAPLDLSVAERSAIALAGQAWSSASLGSLAGTAVRKLEASSPEAREWHVPEVLGRVHMTSADAALLPLMQAIRTDRVVQFTYLSASSSEPLRRTLSPWRLSVESSHWRVTGFDHDRGDQRTFRLSRIHGQVSVTSQPRKRAPESVTGERRDDDALDHRARVRVREGRAGGVRMAAVDCSDPWTASEFDIAFATREALVRALCGAGPDVIVVAPLDVRAAVASRLLTIAAAHQAAPE